VWSAVDGRTASAFEIMLPCFGAKVYSQPTRTAAAAVSQRDLLLFSLGNSPTPTPQHVDEQCEHDGSVNPNE
jgi:hypothetical protein